MTLTMLTMPPADISLAEGEAADPLTVTLTVTLSGPDAAHAATRLINALADGQPQLGPAIWEGEVAEPQTAPAHAPVVIDTVSRAVLVQGIPVRFTRREFDLLFFLGRHAGAAFTRRQLLLSVWGHEFSGERTVDVHVRRLRAKLGGLGPTIATVHGFGYRLEDADQLAVRR